jgi:MFS family permease
MDATKNSHLQKQKEDRQVSSAKRVYILALLTAIWAMSMLDRVLLGVVLDRVKKEFLLSDTMLGLMAGLGFAVIYVILTIPVGRYADRKPRKPIIVIGLTLWSLMTSLGAFAQSGFQLLVFRLGLGVGESSCVAPSMSLVSDYYPKDRRPLAMSIYGMAPFIGPSLAFMIGGPITHYYGWRTAFFICGIPGLILAALMCFTVKEPRRGEAEVSHVEAKSYRLGETLRYLFANKSYLLVLIGFMFISYVSFGLNIWLAPFLGRVHHQNMAQIGLMAGSITLSGAIVGCLLGGWISTAAGRRDDRWKIVPSGIANLIGAGVLALFLLQDSLPAMWFALGLSLLFVAFPCGPATAVIQTVVKVRMRAFAAALNFGVGNMFGLIVAPLVIGMFNDRFKPTFGPTAIRYAMLTLPIMFALSGLCYILAGRYVRQDIKEADREDLETKPVGFHHPSVEGIPGV